MDEILHTKLRRPHSRGPLVQRAELIARLAVATGHRLTLLAAPAGYGKTTLLSAWCAAQSGRPLAWLTLDDGDNDSARFWRYVCAALRPLVPWLPAPPTIGDHAVPAALLNALAELPHRCVLVLDDYHTISAPAVHTALISLLEQAPGTLGLVVSTRDAAPLPLARLRAHNDLAELRSGDLRFTPAEIAALLADGEALPAATLAQIAERTGGWPAGLHLALLALPHDTPPGAAATALAA